MTRLSQIVAVEKGVKADGDRTLTNAYQVLQKAPLLSGITRVYTPKDDAGDVLPPESTKVQVTVDGVLEEVSEALTRMFDVVLTKETANTSAKADVKVGSKVIAYDVPVSYLLFLEKKLTDIHTFLAKLPTLDPSDEWEADENNGGYRSQPVVSVRNLKVPFNHVRAEATKEHPAQVEVLHQDVQAGTWTTTKLSGGLPPARVKTLTERTKALREAVKFAREEANSLMVTDVQTGKAIFDYLLAE